MLRLWRPLALFAFLLALSAQPSLARAHSGASRHTADRHYRHHPTLAWHHGNAFVRANDDTWQQQNSWWQESYWQQQNSWQQQNTWQDTWQVTNTYPARYGRRSRQFEQGWNSRSAGQSFGGGSQLQGMAEQQASANGVPVSLVDRVIKRESAGNPRAVSRGNYGLMQIRLGTARAMGYSGSAEGLLDAQTNMTYAVKYLAGAYHAAGGNEARAIALYASGYGARSVRQASFVTPAPEASFATPAAPAATPHANASGRHLRHHRV